MMRLAKSLLASRTAAFFPGAESLEPFFLQASTSPLVKGSSGPTTVNRFFLLGKSDQAGNIIGLNGQALGQFADAGIAGAQ